MIFGKRKKNFRRTPPPRSSRIPIWLLPTLQKAKASMRTLWTPSSVAETAVPVPSPPSPEDTQDVHFISRSRPSARLRALNVDTPTDSSSAGSHNQQNDLIQQNVPRSIPDEKNSPLSPLPPISPVSVDGVGETRVARRIDIVTSIHKLGHRGQGSALRVDEVDVAVRLRRRGKQEGKTETPRRGFEISRDSDSYALSNGKHCPARRPSNDHPGMGVSRIEDLPLLSHIVSAGSVAQRRRQRLESASGELGVLS